jgi:hypothetical protein
MMTRSAARDSPRDHLDRQIEDRSPFGAPATLLDRGAKCLALLIEQSLHVLQVELGRHRIDRLVGSEKQRHGRPPGDADQVRVEEIGEIGGNGDSASKMAVQINVHHQADIGHFALMRLLLVASAGERSNCRRPSRMSA